MATRRAVWLVAQRLGCIPRITQNSTDVRELVIAAPLGKVFSEGLTHELVVCGSDGEAWATLYADAEDRLAYGLEDCEDAVCDVCKLTE